MPVSGKSQRFMSKVEIKYLKINKSTANKKGEIIVISCADMHVAAKLLNKKIFFHDLFCKPCWISQKNLYALNFRLLIRGKIHKLNYRLLHAINDN